jgi:hypothetical protein
MSATGREAAIGWARGERSTVDQYVSYELLIRAR